MLMGLGSELTVEETGVQTCISDFSSDGLAFLQGRRLSVRKITVERP